MGPSTDQTVKLQNTVFEKDLPQEFRKFDKPFGLEPHIWWIVTVALVHPACIYYLFYLLPFGHVPAATFLLGAFYTYLGGLGITMGAHRYWTHRAFKAKLPLQIILMIWQTISFHNPIFKWCKEHRVHHKYTDTDADPHNINRGFWFAHIGWLLEPRHPKCVEKLKTIDMSDLIADPVVRFQSKYYYELSFLFAFLIPISHCRWLFPETSLFHILIWNMTTFSVSLNAASCVNSVAHMWGDKPYDKNIKSTDNSWVSIYAVGEGWHNYHHTFPWDYKASELPDQQLQRLNVTTQCGYYCIDPMHLWSVLRCWICIEILCRLCVAKTAYRICAGFPLQSQYRKNRNVYKNLLVQ